MQVERIDDLPLILALINRSNLSSAIDSIYPVHGNWSGPSLSIILKVWLLYILTEQDHRLYKVEGWVSARLNSLRYLLAAPDLESKHLSDDRLGLILDMLSKDAQWHEFEKTHNQSFIDIYDLSTDNQAPIRLDAFISQSFREKGNLFQFGASKQRRKDLPQVKTMVATIDPLAMPISSEIVSGNTADDLLYQPVIERVKKQFSKTGLFFVGDSKLGGLPNRSAIHQDKNYYLSPLGKKQCSTEKLKDYLSQKPKRLQNIYKDTESKELKVKAYELKETVRDKEGKSWEERRIIAYSVAYGKSQEKALDKKIEKAKKQLDKILIPSKGKAVITSYQQAEQQVNQYLQSEGLQDYFSFTITEQVEQKQIRAYKDRPARVEKKTSFQLDYQIDQQGLKQAKQLLGWRVYATNTSKETLNTKEVIHCYANEYKIEHRFNQLLNKATKLLPLFLKKENRIKGLIRLLLTALKFLNTMQYQIRNKLEQTQQSIKNIYPGNPGRKTNKPTAEMMLNVFQQINVVYINLEDGRQIIEVSTLNNIQKTILKLLDLDESIYYRLENILFANPKMVEM